MSEETNIKKLTRIIALTLYYGFARYLPAENNQLSLGIGKRIRARICKHIFRRCGRDINVEKNAFFGYGKNIIIGGHSGIGMNSRIFVGEKCSSEIT